MNTRILVIDDEEAYCEILRYNLEKEGYEVDTAGSAEEALQLPLTSYDLMIVDIMMERMSGIDFAKVVHNDRRTELTPIIFCSALAGEDDVMKGLNIGAEDYITKPFTIGIVIARVRAALRRAQTLRAAMAANVATSTQSATPAGPMPEGYEPDIAFQTLRIDQNDKTCYIDGREVALTPKEFELLLFFLSHRERVHSREEIMRQVWGPVEVTNRAVDTNITRLRQKLGAYGDHIVTRQGFGYGFKAVI